MGATAAAAAWPAARVDAGPPAGAAAPAADASGLRPLATGTTPRSLTMPQLRTLEKAVDRILPPTDTPGAAGAGVHWYLDDVARFEPDLLEGLERATALLEERARTRFGDSFVAIADSQRDTLLSELLEGNDDEQRLFSLLKRETVSAYYSSEIGQVGELEWVGHEFHATFPGACPHEDPLVHPRPRVDAGGDE